jgi:integrase
MGYAEKRGNTWRARFKLPDGTYDSEPGFETKDEAKAYANAQETDVRRGDFFDRRTADETTVADWVAQWLAAIDVGPGSEETYDKVLRGHILPRWGESPMTAVTTVAFLAWAKGLKEAYAPTYANQITGLFRLLMGDAVAHQPPLLKISPIPSQNRRRGRYQRPQQDDAVIGTTEQVLKLAQNMLTVWGPVGYVYVLTKAFCGLRQGEIQGLRREWCYPLWPISDPGDHTLRTRAERAQDRKRQREARERYVALPALRVQWQHQYVRPRGGGVRTAELIPPKYESARNLVLPPFLAGLISEVLETHDSPWVFPAPGGGPLLSSAVGEEYWNAALNGAPERKGRYARPRVDPVPGLEEMVPHGLRHGMKAWLDEDGVHSRVAIEARMGHRLAGVEGVYSQVTPVMEANIAAALQERWEKATRK